MHRRTFLKGLSLGGAWLAGCDVRVPMIQDGGGMVSPGGGMVSPGGGLVGPSSGSVAQRIILLWGQSNAKGQGLVANLTATWDFVEVELAAVQLSSDITWPVDGVSAPDYTHGWRNLQPFFNGTGDMGPELGMGYELGAGYAIIKSANGGTDLAGDWAHDTADSKLLYDRSNARVTERLAELPGASVAGLAWVQGTADANNLAFSAAYENNLITFINRLRGLYGSAMPVVLAKLNVNCSSTYTATVRAAQVAVAANVAYVTLADCDDLGFAADHYTADGLAEMGDRLGVAMAALIAAGETAPATPGPYTFGIGNNGSWESVYAENQWTMQEISGPYQDSGSGTASVLFNVGGYMNRATTGLAGRVAWQADATAANADWLEAESVDAGDSDGEDFGFRLVAEAGAGLLPTGDYIIGKWVGGVGWHVKMLSAGRFRLVVDDGVTEYFVTLASDHSTGAPFSLEGWYDQSAQVIYLKSNLDAEVSLSTGTLGSLSNATTLKVNTIGDFVGSGSPDLQVHHVGVTVGADSQSLYDETVVMP